MYAFIYNTPQSIRLTPPHCHPLVDGRARLGQLTDVLEGAVASGAGEALGVERLAPDLAEDAAKMIRI